MRQVSACEALPRVLGHQVEAAGTNAGTVIQRPGTNALMNAALTAFAHHYPLVLSPDDVWLAIAQGFAVHVGLNAEALRGRFVKHQGKAVIELQRPGFVKGSPDNDWQSCFAEFSTKIGEHVGKAADMVTCSFSTTGPIERAASEVTLMDAMQSYFEYRVMTMCGIPNVTLLGTVDDWRSVRQRAGALAEYDLGWWTVDLLPVLDELVAAAGGTPNVRMWQSFVKEHSMSGGDNVSGWINVLFPYLKDWQTKLTTERNPYMARSKWDSDWGGVSTDSFPSGFSSAPFTWNYYGKEFPMKFTAGFAGVAQDPDSLALRPAIGWAVSDADAVQAPDDDEY